MPPLIPFPNVPNVPGVPALLRSFTVPSAGAILNRVLGAAAAEVFGQNIWGIFDSKGTEVLVADSFLSIDYQNGARVSQAPQEEGSFASYNKVANPFDCTVMLTIGADKAARTAFLQKVEDMLASTDLFTVVTPERTYTNASLENSSYRRNSANGVTLITVTLNFVQIRSSATSTTTPTQDASGADIVSDGQVQIAEPTADEIALAGATA